MSQAAVAPSKVSGHTILAFDFGTRWIGVAGPTTRLRSSISSSANGAVLGIAGIAAKPSYRFR